MITMGGPVYPGAELSEIRPVLAPTGLEVSAALPPGELGALREIEGDPG